MSERMIENRTQQLMELEKQIAALQQLVDEIKTAAGQRERRKNDAKKEIG